MPNLVHVNPDNVPAYLPFGLSHAVISEGGRTIYLSGQVGWNSNSELVGPDLQSQLGQAHENIRRVLAAAGASPADIVRLNTYVANYKPEDGEIVNAANRSLFGDHVPASATLLGVQSLYAPEILCEVEATAVIA